MVANDADGAIRSNPALKAMGLSKIKLPSRNWLIFGTVLTACLSGAYYDKHQQKKIRTECIESVKENSYKAIDVNKRPRKITVFIAPPPSDYLDVSLKIWRRYIKPVLFYAGLDYEIIEEQRQGIIRSDVASRMRDVRKRLLEKSSPKQGDAMVCKDESLENKPDDGRDYKKNFDYRDIMGIFRKSPKQHNIVSEDSVVEDPALVGGVICLGRGAYKEYITGLHEGLLGPLEPPTDVPNAVATKEMAETNESKLKEINDATPAGTSGTAPNESTSTEANYSQSSEREAEITDSVTEIKPEEKNDSEDDVNEIKPKVKYITPDKYADTEIPPEISQALLQGNNVIRDPKDNVPILLHQPILAIPVPNLIGFLNIPERIYRFYSKRHYVENTCKSVTDLIKHNNIRPFQDPSDLSMIQTEEEDWPSKWVKQGKERKSEWTTELGSDDRISTHINVINSEPLKQPPKTSETTN